MEYSGIVEMDNYRTEQAKWLEEAVEKPDYKDAKYKIIICHMPPFGGWHGEQEINPFTENGNCGRCCQSCYLPVR